MFLSSFRSCWLWVIWVWLQQSQLVNFKNMTIILRSLQKIALCFDTLGFSVKETLSGTSRSKDCKKSVRIDSFSSDLLERKTKATFEDVFGTILIEDFSAIPTIQTIRGFA
jgi:hypothetical protein